MDPAFADAAFALKKVGDLSEPVLSSFGYHLIRLDGRKPGRVKSFDEVKEALVSEERGKYVAEQRDLAVTAIREDPMSRINQPAVDALVVKVDQDFLVTLKELVQPRFTRADDVSYRRHTFVNDFQ